MSHWNRRRQIITIIERTLRNDEQEDQEQEDQEQQSHHTTTTQQHDPSFDDDLNRLIDMTDDNETVDDLLTDVVAPTDVAVAASPPTSIDSSISFIRPPPGINVLSHRQHIIRPAPDTNTDTQHEAALTPIDNSTQPNVAIAVASDTTSAAVVVTTGVSSASSGKCMISHCDIVYMKCFSWHLT